NKRDAELLVVFQSKRPQGFVTFVDVSVTVTREITTVNVGARELVTNSLLLIKISVEQFPLFVFRQHRKYFGRRIGQRTANSEKRLKLTRGIHENTDLRFLWLADVFERRCGRLRDSMIRVC